MNPIITQIIGGLIGMSFHIFAVKLPSYKAKCLAGNIPFNMRGYFDCDWMAIVASLIAVLIAVFAMDEAISIYNPIQQYIKFFMVFIGYTGSSLLIAWLGQANKSALKIIDKKTNIADGVTAGENASHD